jgi:hypothetical protein
MFERLLAPLSVKHLFHRVAKVMDLDAEQTATFLLSFRQGDYINPDRRQLPSSVESKTAA